MANPHRPDGLRAKLVKTLMEGRRNVREARRRQDASLKDKPVPKCTVQR
jgi:hypothetical protein